MEPAGSTFVLSSASARRLLEDRWSGPVIISYAQNAEDVRLARLFDSSSGFYVDIGAGDPTEFSVTKHFYDRGWSGINVEPGPAFERLEQQRPRDVNLRLAVAPRVGGAGVLGLDSPLGPLDVVSARPIGAGSRRLSVRATVGHDQTAVGHHPRARRRQGDRLPDHRRRRSRGRRHSLDGLRAVAADDRRRRSDQPPHVRAEPRRLGTDSHRSRIQARNVRRDQPLLRRPRASSPDSGSRLSRHGSGCVRPGSRTGCYSRPRRKGSSTHIDEARDISHPGRAAGSPDAYERRWGAAETSRAPDRGRCSSRARCADRCRSSRDGAPFVVHWHRGRRCCLDDHPRGREHRRYNSLADSPASAARGSAGGSRRRSAAGRRGRRAGQRADD